MSVRSVSPGCLSGTPRGSTGRRGVAHIAAPSGRSTHRPRSLETFAAHPGVHRAAMPPKATIEPCRR
jgi:hypothetical protein